MDKEALVEEEEAAVVEVEAIQEELVEMAEEEMETLQMRRKLILRHNWPIAPQTLNCDPSTKMQWL